MLPAVPVEVAGVRVTALRPDVDGGHTSGLFNLTPDDPVKVKIRFSASQARYAMEKVYSRRRRGK